MNAKKKGQISFSIITLLLFSSSSQEVKTDMSYLKWVIAKIADRNIHSSTTQLEKLL